MNEISGTPVVCATQQTVSMPDKRSGSIWRWVCPQTIVLDVEAIDKQQALELVASLCERFQNLAPGPTLRALLRREEVGSTGLGQGIAIPHARIDGINEPVTLFVRLKAPIEFGAPDGKLVSQLFVILVPAEGTSDEHLELLAGVAEMLSDRSLRRLLADASEVSEVRRALVQWISSKIGSDADTTGVRGAASRSTKNSVVRGTGAC